VVAGELVALPPSLLVPGIDDVATAADLELDHPVEHTVTLPADLLPELVQAATVPADLVPELVQAATVPPDLIPELVQAATVPPDLLTELVDVIARRTVQASPDTVDTCSDSRNGPAGDVVHDEGCLSTCCSWCAEVDIFWRSPRPVTRHRAGDPSTAGGHGRHDAATTRRVPAPPHGRRLRQGCRTPVDRPGQGGVGCPGSRLRRWSGRRESNSHVQLGKLALYH